MPRIARNALGKKTRYACLTRAKPLRRQHASYPGLKVAVRGEASGSLQQTVEVLHAVRTSGVDQIGISTQRMRR